tara:strand:+ start:2866 stop:3159 length:294 start_codon:yes stop_codon:yes gene_type:complete
MPMPKGHKSKHGYATVGLHGGLGYREIAETMTESGDVMNHSTARNVFIKAMKKIARDACSSSGVRCTDTDIERIATDPRFQSGLIDIITNEPYSIPL